MALSGPLQQLPIAAARAAVDKVVDLYRKQKAKEAAQDKFANTPNQPWGCPHCKNWNYLGGAVCSRCGKPKP